MESIVFIMLNDENNYSLSGLIKEAFERNKIEVAELTH